MQPPGGEGCEHFEGAEDDTNNCTRRKAGLFCGRGSSNGGGGGSLGKGEVESVVGSEFVRGVVGVS